MNKKEEINSVIGTDLSLITTEEELTEISIKAHKEDQEQYDITQNSLCFVVLGSIVFIVGLLFLFLSFKRKMNKLVGINFEGFQFYVFIVGVTIGLACLIYGLVRFFTAYEKRKALKTLINNINYRRKG